MTTTTPSLTGAGAGKGRNGHAPARPPLMIQRRQRFGWLFVAPFALIFVIFLILPLAYALWLSLHTQTLVLGTRLTWFANYKQVFTDPAFLGGVKRVLAFAVVMVPVQIASALIVALVLDTLTTRLAAFARLMVFLPYAVPAVIGAIMWGFLYSPDFGPIAAAARGLHASPPDLLGTGSIFWALVNVVTWQWVGYYMIIIYSALQGIDPQIYEAARMDGASDWQTAVRIKVPMISSTLVLTAMFSIIGTLQFFTEPQVLQAVAPGAIPPEYTPNMYAFAQAFSYSSFNYASAISFALGVIVFAGSYIFMFATRKRSGLR